MSKGSKIVSSALLGFDIATCFVNGKCYVIKPPTIHILAGVGHSLGELGEARDISTILQTALYGAEGCAKALSYLITGDESLTEELSKGTFDEIVNGIEKGLSLISTENFFKLSALTKNVAMLIARPK